MKKAHWRKKYVARRQALAKALYQQQSQEIQARFFQQFDLVYYPYLHTYLACPERQEVATWGIVQTVFAEHPGVVVAAPKLLDGAGEMQSYAITPTTSFQQHAWGIQEPVSRILVPAAAFLLVVLPVIAFDAQGYRVGYGQGYYDRFLKQCRPDVTKVGLCFEGPVPAIDDLSAYDVPMDYCITPRQVFRWPPKGPKLRVEAG